MAYQEKNLLEIYKCFQISEYAQLTSYAYELISVFGSVCIYEKTLNMRYVQFYWRSPLTDEQLHLILIKGNTDSDPNLGKILSLKQNSDFLLGRFVLKIVLNIIFWISSIKFLVHYFLSLYKCLLVTYSLFYLSPQSLKYFDPSQKKFSTHLLPW